MSAGNIVNVQEVVAGSELVADAAAASTTITVDDPTDFQPDGGELELTDADGATEEVAYSTLDEQTGVIGLDAPLAGDYLEGDRVTVLPRTTERFAHVQLEDQEETLVALIPHGLYDRLTVGLRDPNADELELVDLARDSSGELIVANVREREPLVDGGFIDPGSTIPPEAITDGNPPATSPTPSVFGGVLSLFVTWVPVANADPVTYEVHVSTSSGFTPDASTFAGESRGTMHVIRALPGTTDPPAYGTTYYVKLVAKDADGEAAASAEDSATPEEGMAEAIVADLIAANAVLAEKLEAVLVMTSTLVAGALGAGRVELGVATDESGLIGIQAYDEDGTTVNFLVDAETGQVYVRGRLDFGAGSRLTAEDIVELAEQTPAAFQEPVRVQANGASGIGTSGSVSWPSPTTAGNLLLLAVHIYDADFAVPTPTTPSGWALAASVLHSDNETRTLLYCIEDASARSGAQAISFNDSVVWTLQLFEYAGVEELDQVASDKGAGTALATGTTATTTQADELWIAMLAYGVTTDTVGPESPSDSFVPVRQQVHSVSLVRQAVFEKKVTATGAAGMTATAAQGVHWTGLVATFKAKPSGVATPEAGKVRVYAEDVDDVARLHAMHEDGVDGAVVLGKAGEVWRLEHVAASVNIPDTPAHSGGNLNVTIPGLAVGDLCFFMGAANPARAFPRTTRPVCASAGVIVLDYFNSDSSAVNPAAEDYHFLVIHRS